MGILHSIIKLDKIVLKLRLELSSIEKYYLSVSLDKDFRKLYFSEYQSKKR